MIDSSIWGAPLSQYDNMNARTGATDLENSDYTDFPPFVKNDFSALGENPTGGVLSDDTLFVAYYNDGYLNPSGHWNFNNPLDLTIAYTACSNPDLPLNDIGAIGTDTFAESIGDNYNFLPPRLDKVWLYKNDPNDPQPIVFINSVGYMTQRPNTSGNYQLTGVLHNPLYSNTYPPMFLYYQGGEYDRDNAGWDTTTKKNKININLYMSYWRDFGIRCLFGVIMLYYFDGTYNNNTGIPQNVVQTPVSLHWYETQTTLWKHEHPIISAHLSLYIRGNIDGTYTDSRRVNYCFVPDLTCNLRFNENWGSLSNGRILQPISNYVKNSKSYLPLFGHMPAGAGVTNTPDVIALIGNQKLDGTGGVSSTSGILLGTRFVRGGFKNETTSTVGLKSFWCELEGDNDDNLELLRRTAAGYGLFFADDVYNLADSGRDSDRWTDNNMCLGVVNQYGYTDGTYTRGAANEGANNFLWRTARDTTYDPTRPPPSPDDPTIYSDTTDFNLLGGVASCNKMYAVKATSIMNLARAISTAVSLRGADVPPLDYSIETFLTNNPLDCIINLRYYPTTAIITGTEEPIAFGAYSNANVVGIPFVGSFKKVDFRFSVSARNALYPHFADFRDYEPFTHAELIVPFCGTVQINPADFIGHDINVHMIIDYITGSCTAYIAADGLVVTSIAGQVGIDVPLSGIQQATLDGQRVNAVMARQSAELNATNAAVGGLTSSIGFAGSLAGDNIVGAIGTGAGVIQSINRYQQADISYQKADYDLKHMQVPFKTVSAGSAVASTVIESCCRLIIYRPVMAENYDPVIYGRTIGFACLMNGTVSDFTGLTVGDINTSGLQLTENEKNQIQKAFANGVII